MKIVTIKNKARSEEQALIQALRLDPSKRSRISVVGGGGKTTIIERLAKEYASYHEKVVIAPTTKIAYPQFGSFLWSENEDFLREVKGVVTVGVAIEQEKVGKTSDVFFQKIFNLAGIVLMEADGAKRLPAKAPAEHEPVILTETTDVIAVLGLDSIGHPIGQVCHRSELVCELLQKGEEDIFLPEDAAFLLSSEKGQRKQVRDGMVYHVILNQADTDERMDIAMEIAVFLKEKGINEVIATSSRWRKSE